MGQKPVLNILWQSASKTQTVFPFFSGIVMYSLKCMLAGIKCTWHLHMNMALN